MRRTLIAALIVCLVPLVAAAQSGGFTQGPMTVERIHSGVLVAPDFKVTEVDRKTSELVGGYAGWLTDDRFFVGGAGYWMANQSRDREMAYGGVLVQWLMRTNARIGFSAKGLVGGGQATLSDDYSIRLPDGRTVSALGRIDADDLARGTIVNSRFRFREAFFVAEPEGNVLLRLTSHLRLTGGIGYRFTTSEGRDGKRLRGAAGSVGLQIGGGS